MYIYNVHCTIHSPVHCLRDETNGGEGRTQTDERYVCTLNYCKHKYLQLAKFSEGKQAHYGYSSTLYVGMTPKKNDGHIESAQMTCSKCLR